MIRSLSMIVITLTGQIAIVQIDLRRIYFYEGTGLKHC